MKDGADWQAANPGPKGGFPGPEAAWVRSHPGTWFRPAAAPAQDHPDPAGRPGRALVAASRVCNLSVLDHRGRRLGRIADLAIDEATGAVVLVRLAAGGFLGLARPARLLSWAALAFSPDRGAFVLSRSRKEAASLAEATARGIEWSEAADRRGWADGA